MGSRTTNSAAGGRRTRSWRKVLLWTAGSVVAALALVIGGGTVYIGATGGDGPFRDIYINQLIEKSKDVAPGGVVFYGASNFRLWHEMSTDLAPFTPINNAFGGSTDADLIAYADRLLFPLEPSIVAVQTGSNDLAGGLTLEQVLDNKQRMYTQWRERLPQTTFVIMSSLPLPGRQSLWEDSRKTNEFLAEFAASNDGFVFVDATSVMLTADGGFRPEYFGGDQIHLNRDGQRAWATVILPALTEADGRR